MAHTPICINPVSIKNKIDDGGFNVLVDHGEERAEAINSLRPYLLDFEATNKCAGSCAYCYASSEGQEHSVIPEEKIRAVLDEAWDLGVRRIQWAGGDAIAHPNWQEHVSYASEKGIESLLATGGLVSKRDARRIVALGEKVIGVGTNIASIDQKVYDKVHTNPATLEKKIQGYRNLLEAGYPADRIMVLITLTRPVIDTIEETMDFFIDEMGCCSFCLIPFRVCGFGKGNKQWEPGLSDVKRALMHRAKRLGEYWLRIGSSDGSHFYCRAAVAILYDGSVVPCTMMREQVAGNIYKESFKDIFLRDRDNLLFNHPVKGHCGGECENSDMCFGCRANAYHYLGDAYASDPKCFMNPEAKEWYYH